MADEPNANGTVDTSQAGAADQPAGSNPAPTGLSADQVQQMIDKAYTAAYNRGAADTRRSQDKKQPSQPSQPSTPNQSAPNDSNPPNTQQPQAAAIDGFELSESLAEFTLTKEQRKTIRDLAGKENPDNLDEFVAKWAGLFGAKTASASAAQSPNNTTAATQQPPPSQAKPPTLPAPGATQDREFDTVFKAMSEDAARDTWQAYVRRKGANPANPYDPKNRGAWREMRKQFEAQVAVANIQLGARRGS